VTVFFATAVYTFVEGSRLESGERGMGRSGFLRGWELLGRVRGSWVSLDTHEGTDVLGDEHAFTLEGLCGVVVDVVRL
jgi:hypothetical protein